MLAQVIQTTPIIQVAGLTQFETLLISGLVAVVLGISGFITWIIRGIGPRMMLGFEKRNDAFISASEKTADAVTKIPEAINGFKLALVETKTELVEKLDVVQDKIVDEIHNKRLSDIEEAVRTGQHAAMSSNPSIPSFSSPVVGSPGK